MITLNNLTYRYRKGTTAIDSVSTQIGSGMHLLLGENGAGKTTLLKLMAGLLFPCSGQCLIDGTASGKREPETMAKLFFLGDNMTYPAQTINIMARIHAPFYPNFSDDRLKENLSMFGMTGDEKLTSLSLGNRHKAQVAYALALGAEILLMDEPTNGLDITSKQTLARMISQCVSDEQTVIVSTHNVDNFPNLYDGVMVMSHGRMLLNTPTWQITERVTFRGNMIPPEAPLYLEQHFGLYRSIEPNTDGTETTIDYTLLYNGLMSPSRDKILQHLNTQNTPQL